VAFLLHLFFQRLRLRQRLPDEIRFLQRNNTYSIVEMLLALLYREVSVGVRRPRHLRFSA